MESEERMRKSRKRTPIRREDLDRSGRVKASTLEFFATHPGWHTATRLLEEPELRRLYALDSGNRAIQMRLLRYVRQGILTRRGRTDIGAGTSRQLEYAMTNTGRDRLVHLWEKLGYLNPANAVSKIDRKQMDERLALADMLLGEKVDDLIRQKEGLQRWPAQ